MLTNADYQMNIPKVETQSVAEDALDDARDVIDALNSCSEAPRRLAAVAAIKEKKRRISSGGTKNQTQL